VLSCIMLNNGNLFALMVRLRVAKGEGRTGRKPGKLGVAVGKQALSRSSPHLRRSASRPGATIAHVGEEACVIVDSSRDSSRQRGLVCRYSSRRYSEFAGALGVS
jgi:hypothetical protein